MPIATKARTRAALTAGEMPRSDMRCLRINLNLVCWAKKVWFTGWENGRWRTPYTSLVSSGLLSAGGLGLFYLFNCLFPELFNDLKL